MSYENEIDNMAEPNLFMLEQEVGHISTFARNMENEVDRRERLTNELLFACAFELRLVRITLNEILDANIARITRKDSTPKSK